ncbi:hypothetical protein [Endozoicomonas sp. SCSIO W0465]|uniref:hypothetical protein n=1 Tax=Endozoicomonas sp. SCSIO W0465 TaxID=2918516 RepID=UPI00207657EC|nr:hypothetical protein [Endozoicomonas sp. SCSIO W0465]USE35289.1 hypothetical protein MJO57_24795 [Endozoicomonas sp. SCSIO W0465]
MDVQVMDSRRPTLLGRQNPASSPNPSTPSRTVRAVKPEPPWLMDTTPESDKGISVDNGQVSEPVSPETESPTSYELDSHSPSRPSSAYSGAHEDWDDDTIEDFALQVDDDDLLSITSELADAPHNLGVDESGDQFSEIGTAMSEVINDNRDLLSPDHQLQFPAVKTPEDGAETTALKDELAVESLSIEGGRVDNAPVVKGEGSVDIKGGGKTTKKTIGQRILAALKKLGNWIEKNPLWAGFVIFIVAFFICLAAASGYGLIIGATVCGICALTFLGLAIGVKIRNTFFSNEQNPSQTNNGQNPNPQQTHEGRTRTDPEKPTKTESGTSPRTKADETDGKFVMTESQPQSVANSEGKPPVRENKVSTAATQTVGEQNDDDLAQNLEKLLQLINENFSPFSNESHVPEQWNRNSRDPNRKIDEQTLEEVSAAAERLIDQFRHIADHRDIKGSDTIQHARMHAVQSEVNRLMNLINPTKEFIKHLEDKIRLKFPDPRLAPDPEAPPLTIGEVRRRLANFADKDLKGIEFFDLLMEFLRAAKAYRNDRNDRIMDRFGQVRPEVKPTPSPMQTSTPETAIEFPNKTDSGGSLDEGRQEARAVRYKRVLRRHLEPQQSDIDLNDTSNLNVREQAFLINIRDGISDWFNQKQNHRRESKRNKADMTTENYQDLVVTELGKAVFGCAKEHLQQAKVEHGKNGDQPTPVDLRTPESRAVFLQEIFDSDEINEAFAGIEASDYEQRVAKKHFLDHISKRI